MLLTLTATGSGDRPATDLGYLLHKDPDRVQDFSVEQLDPLRLTLAHLLEPQPSGAVWSSPPNPSTARPRGSIGRYSPG